MRYLGSKMPRARDATSQAAQMQDLRTSSQFLQEEFRSHSDPKKPSSKSIGGGLGETFAKMSQVYRQRVTHLMSDGGEVPRMRESSGGSVKLSPSSNCCGGCATTLDLNYSENEVCSLSILSSNSSSSPSCTTSRGSTTSPRSPTRLPSPSTSSGAGRSRTATGQCMSSDCEFVI